MLDRKYYHYTFATYNRAFVLDDKEIRESLVKWFYEIANERRFEIISLSVLADHVHILIEQKLNDSPAYIMKCIKGASSYKFFKGYRNSDRFVFRKLWSRSYHCRDVGPEALKDVADYIKNQTDKMGVDKRFLAGAKRSRHV